MVAKFAFFLSCVACFMARATSAWSQWHLLIGSELCNYHLKECAMRICEFSRFQYCQNAIQMHYSSIIPHLCGITNRCIKVRLSPIGPEEDRITCRSDFHCLSGQKCREGVCMMEKQGKRCTWNWECAASYWCNQQECVLKDGIAQVSQPPMCKFDSQCGAGKLCKNGVCVPKVMPTTTPAPPKPTKPYKQGKSCEASPECAAGYKCKNFECVLA